MCSYLEARLYERIHRHDAALIVIFLFASLNTSPFIYFQF